MLLIFTHTSTTRLQYICKFIFKEQLGLAYSLTIDADGFTNYDGPKINYSNAAFANAFHIEPHALLFEKKISNQQIQCFETNGYKAFFRTNSVDTTFDIFAASFYLLSRYEEYLPHEKDMYGRYAHINALAWKEGFLNTPLVNLWLKDFGKILIDRFPALRLKLPAFTFIPTYDIDIAWSYKNKGLLRNLGGFIKNPSLDRLKVLTGFKEDPFNSYDFLDPLHADKNFSPVYFFLVAAAQSIYDKNISPQDMSMQQLIKQHSEKYETGLHPSWKSNDSITILRQEKAVLEAAVNAPVKRSRQHYIKFSLPATMENLIELGIEHDYSMGYGSINGFRASVASSFFWYNLEKEMVTTMRVHPFCFMDANSFYEQKLNSKSAWLELFYYQGECRKVNGTLITIFHNNFLGTDKKFAGWREMYSRFIGQLP